MFNWRREPCEPVSRLDGKTIVITGASDGIGRLVAHQMALLGAQRIIMGCRNVVKGQKVAMEIMSGLVTETKSMHATQCVDVAHRLERVQSLHSDVCDLSADNLNSTAVIVKYMELSSLGSVEMFAQEILLEEVRVDVLINNAGIMAVPFQLTEDKVESQFQVNHLGHFLLTTLLLPLLKKSSPSRVINVTSVLHQWGKIHFNNINLEGSAYSPFKAYMQSKLANILFTRELHRLYKDCGVTAYAVHPGVISTNLHESVTGMLKYPFRLSVFLLRPFLKSAVDGASDIVYAVAREGLEEHSGSYFVDQYAVSPSKSASDSEAATGLWKLSQQMVTSVERSTDRSKVNQQIEQ